MVTSDTPKKSSFVARLAWLKDRPDFGCEVIDELGWPSDFETILKAKAAADLVILHRVLFDDSQRARFFVDGKPVIFDMDDAIYSVPSGLYRRELKSVQGWSKRVVRTVLRGRPDFAGRHRPLVGMLKHVTAVAAGNPHLARFASQYCPMVEVIPTVVNVDRFSIKTHRDGDPVRIGWYGSPDNQWYLSEVAEPFRRLKEAFGERVRFAVISAEQYSEPGIPFEWIPWRLETELSDILSFDVGIMPLTDDEWARGKSGNKALYYMASAIPPVVSPVGVNADIVQHGQNGFWARTENEWFEALSTLVRSAEIRARLGANARDTVLREYSRHTAVAKMSNLVSRLVKNHEFHVEDSPVNFG